MHRSHPQRVILLGLDKVLTQNDILKCNAFPFDPVQFTSRTYCDRKFQLLDKILADVSPFPLAKELHRNAISKVLIDRGKLDARVDHDLFS